MADHQATEPLDKQLLCVHGRPTFKYYQAVHREPKNLTKAELSLYLRQGWAEETLLYVSKKAMIKAGYASISNLSSLGQDLQFKEMQKNSKPATYP